LPHWFIAGFFAAFAATTWVRQLRWRFSLRTLLIATTLVAVVLGAIVWSIR
jgi:branched-subunit amino acid ABC-type transport system permease component